MESVSEPGLLSLLGGQSFDWLKGRLEEILEIELFWYVQNLEIEVVVQMQIVQILSMDEQVQHVVALAQHLQSNFHPIQRGRLEELGRLEGAEKITEIKE